MWEPLGWVIGSILAAGIGVATAWLISINRRRW